MEESRVMIYVGMIAYNEELFIGASLKSIYDYVDKIIVIDGSAWGPSTDKTAEIARSVGSKVEVVSGTYKREGGRHKILQRQAYIDKMEKGKDNWCILHDADEVFFKEQIKNLVGHIHTASPHTMLFHYPWVHFWKDCWHTIAGGNWSDPRAVGTFRLVDGVRMYDHNGIGVKDDWRLAGSPIHVGLGDVFFYHYGHASTYEKAEFKAKYYVNRGDFINGAYHIEKSNKKYLAHEWERYKKETFIPLLNRGFDIHGVKPYAGEHPPEIQLLIGTHWKKSEAYVDIGELGWSLYLSAHLRWLKAQGKPVSLVVTLPDRKCLYEGIADEVLDVPPKFYTDFKDQPQTCFGLGEISDKELRGYFDRKLPPGYCVADLFSFHHLVYHPDFGKENYRSTIKKQTIYIPYPHKKEVQDKKEILVFPRCRQSQQVNAHLRNLPQSFYVELINALCKEFQEFTIRTMGVVSGSYSIELDQTNYINSVTEVGDIQNVIDACQSAKAAVGSQSALVKLSLLQGIPTFIVGHEKKRHAEDENWMGTKVGFYEISDYCAFDNKECIERIVLFIKEQI